MLNAAQAARAADQVTAGLQRLAEPEVLLEDAERLTGKQGISVKNRVFQDFPMTFIDSPR